jgi:hypothetical protein
VAIFYLVWRRLKIIFQDFNFPDFDFQDPLFGLIFLGPKWFGHFVFGPKKHHRFSTPCPFDVVSVRRHVFSMPCLSTSCPSTPMPCPRTGKSNVLINKNWVYNDWPKLDWPKPRLAEDQLAENLNWPTSRLAESSNWPKTSRWTSTRAHSLRSTCSFSANFKYFC